MPGGPRITGQTRITARLSNGQGVVTEPRSIDDADSVLVHLRKPDGTYDSTLTVDGRYEFPVSATGIYQVRAWVAAPDTVSAPVVTVATTDANAPATQVPGTLELLTTGDLRTYPNPFPTVDGLAIEFDTQGAQRIEVVILSLRGVPVWSYSQDVLNGFQHYHWFGTNDANEELSNGSYWVRVRFNDHYHYNLVFKQ